MSYGLVVQARQLHSHSHILLLAALVYVICSIGQNLAKLELQVVLSTLLSRFKFSPGQELEKELQVAAATGQPATKAVQALAGAFVTLQPLAGRMHLKIAARAEPEPEESSAGPLSDE